MESLTFPPHRDHSGSGEGGSVVSVAPALSVVMAVRNVEPWIHEAVTSVLTQAVEAVECIVVDDHSTDGTREVLSLIKDSRLQVVTNPGRGGGTARNFGAELAVGEYLAFADGDDLVPREGYQALIQQARTSGAEMVIGSYVIAATTQLNTRHQWTGMYGRVIEDIRVVDQPQYLRDRVCWNRVFLRESWIDAGVSFTDSPRSNDIVAMTQAYCAFNFDVIPNHVYIYRRRTGGSSMTARRHDPESIAAHFAQERLCVSAIRQLQDQRSIATYSAEMLENDVWSHLGPLLSTEAGSARKFEVARREARSVITALLPAADEHLDPLKRLTYSLVDAGDWELAAHVNEFGVDGGRAFEFESANLRKRLRSIKLRPSEFFSSVVTTSLVPLIREHESLPEARLRDLLRAGQQLVAHRGVRRRVAPGDRFLFEISVAAPIAEVRAHLDADPPRTPLVDRALRLGSRSLKTLARVAAGGARGMREEVIASIENHGDRVHAIAERTPWSVRKMVRRLLGRQ